VAFAFHENDVSLIGTNVTDVYDLSVSLSSILYAQSRTLLRVLVRRLSDLPHDKCAPYQNIVRPAESSKQPPAYSALLLAAYPVFSARGIE